MFKKLNYVIFTILIFNNLNAESIDVIKTKKEVERLKKDLAEFYDRKEAELEAKKKELLAIQAKTKKMLDEIDATYKKNKQVLDDIKNATLDKVSQVYAKAKPKIAASIFIRMIEFDDRLDDVIDIMMKLKPKQASKILAAIAKTNTAVSSIITEKMKFYKNPK